MIKAGDRFLKGLYFVLALAAGAVLIDGADALMRWILLSSAGISW